MFVRTTITDVYHAVSDVRENHPSNKQWIVFQGFLFSHTKHGRYL